MESSPATMSSPSAAAMQVAPASSSRSRDPRLFGNFDLPAAWGCRRPMAFCKDLDALASGPSVAASEPRPKSSRSPPKGTAAQHAPAAEEGAAAQEAPRKQCYLLRDRKAGRDSAEDAQHHKKLRNMDGVGGGGGKKSSWFSVQLTKQEIEEDFVAITGQKPPRRRKRRPYNVQRQIDSLCPGDSLSEVSRDRYKVNEKGGF